MNKLILVFAFSILIVTISNAQTVKGIIYEDNTTAKNILISNTSQNIKTYSDYEGFFNINGKLNDTIVFGSLFHETKSIILEAKHFNESIVIELKKVVNKLNEVHIRNEPVIKEFEVKAYTENVQNQIKRDMELRPYLYGLSMGGSNAIKGNIGQLVGLIGKLFKSKKKKEIHQSISYNDFKALFESDSFFNSALLHEQLKIPLEFKYLFFEYCAAQQLNKNLLSQEDNFLLLDNLMKCSNTFLAIIEAYKED